MRLVGEKPGGLLHDLTLQAQPRDCLAPLPECGVLGGQVTVTAPAPVGVPRGLTLPVPAHLRIAPQGASGFRDPVAMCRHQTDRCLCALLWILPSLFGQAGHLLK
jgi:hypothetical protein